MPSLMRDTNMSNQNADKQRNSFEINREITMDRPKRPKSDFKSLPQTWKPGISGNPHGRPRKGRSAIETLEAALEKVEKEYGKSFIEHFVEKAYTNDRIAIALFNKLFPNVISPEVQDAPAQIVYVGIPLSKTGEIPANLPPEVRAAVMLKLNSTNQNNEINGIDGKTINP